MRLLLITGPPAVGKMTVGRAVAAQSDFRLFHNHHTITGSHSTLARPAIRIHTTAAAASHTGAENAMRMPPPA